jgi:hypothetical protein
VQASNTSSTQLTQSIALLEAAVKSNCNCRLAFNDCEFSNNSSSTGTVSSEVNSTISVVFEINFVNRTAEARHNSSSSSV